MKNYLKLIVSIPLAGALVFGSSVFTSPAAAQVEQTDELFYFKPVPEPEPNKPLPITGEKITKESDIEQYVYIDIVATKYFPAGATIPCGPGVVFEQATLVDRDLNVIPKTNGRYYLKTNVSIEKGEIIGKWAVPKDLDWVQGTKSAKDYYYKRLHAHELNKTSSYSYESSITTGVSQEEAFAIAQTLGIDVEVGYKHAFQIGTNGMWQTTESIGTTLLNQDSERHEFNLPQAVYNYGYTTFWAGVYQGIIDYYVKPSVKLQEVLDDFNRPPSGNHQLEINLRLPEKQTQKTNIFHTVRTKGSGNPIPKIEGK
ncbi:hypothetical protein BM86_23780 [Bacillus thuringiensis]|uniref:Uncharacterized protein n=1 Tax=Bacillus thuringiensis TaxID=1428 RepID=A0A9W3SI95_BACTU|nr:hypothetical protein [Bacillus thuringiensis]ANS52025.1 hypothetical protein BT246_67330 [Bacillus thuringiensis]MBH0338428.1 hypothetical protein [Bacillus thuringiensis]